MRCIKFCSKLFASVAMLVLAAGLARAADKPNIVIIRGDDIGQSNISAYLGRKQEPGGIRWAAH